jgi:hypothetical protein
MKENDLREENKLLSAAVESMQDIIDSYVKEDKKKITEDHNYLISTLKQFRNKWCDIKNAKELNDLCSYYINEVWKDKISKKENEK